MLGVETGRLLEEDRGWSALFPMPPAPVKYIGRGSELFIAIPCCSGLLTIVNGKVSLQFGARLPVCC